MLPYDLNNPQLQALLNGKGPQGAQQVTPARNVPFGSLPPGSGGPSGPTLTSPQQNASIPAQRPIFPPGNAPPQQRQPTLMEQLQRMQSLGVKLPGGLFGAAPNPGVDTSAAMAAQFPEAAIGAGTPGSPEARAAMLQRLLASGLLG